MNSLHKMEGFVFLNEHSKYRRLKTKHVCKVGLVVILFICLMYIYVIH